MSSEAEVIDVKEEAAKQFFDNSSKLDTLIQKVSREGLKRVFKILTVFPYVGEDITAVKNEHETELMKTVLYMQGLKTQFENKDQIDEAKETVVDSMVASTLEQLERTNTDEIN